MTAGTFSWHAGDVPRGNLGGTVSTLSGVDGSIPLNCTGASAPGTATGGGKGATDMHCTLGVASRDGWAIVRIYFASPLFFSAPLLFVFFFPSFFNLLLFPKKETRLLLTLPSQALSTLTYV